MKLPPPNPRLCGKTSDIHSKTVIAESTAVPFFSRIRLYQQKRKVRLDIIYFVSDCLIIDSFLMKNFKYI